jgi:transcriptional regulator with XRE-family HTH domain
MLAFLPKTPTEIQLQIRDRFRSRRKALKLTQKELSSRSDVSLGSLKRFEQIGEISFDALLKIALVLECLDDFEGVCGERDCGGEFGGSG